MYKITSHLKLYFGLAFLIALSATSSALAQQSVVTFLGRVTDQNTGQGISGVAVAALGNQTGTRVVVTDAQGNYTLPLGANTNIKLRAYKTGYVFSPLASEFIVLGGGPLTGARTENFTGVALPFQILLFAQPPILLTEDGSLNALALDAVLHTRDPFPVVSDNYLGADKRTRLKLFLFDMDLYSGETLSLVTAQAEDEQHRTYALAVEDLRKVPGSAWLSQLTVRLPGELTGATSITLSVTARGQTSNQAKLLLK